MGVLKGEEGTFYMILIQRSERRRQQAWGLRRGKSRPCVYRGRSESDGWLAAKRSVWLGKE